MHVLLALFVVGALAGILIVVGVGLSEEGGIDVNGSPFHGSSTDVAKGTGQVDACRSEGLANFAYPAFSGHFCQAHTALVETDVAHAAEDDEVVVRVVAISADLAFGIFELTFPVFFLDADFTLGYLLAVESFPVCLHVLEILFLLRV
jgi:hypothetical protein